MLTNKQNVGTALFYEFDSDHSVVGIFTFWVRPANCVGMGQKQRFISWSKSTLFWERPVSVIGMGQGGWKDEALIDIPSVCPSTIFLNTWAAPPLLRDGTQFATSVLAVSTIHSIQKKKKTFVMQELSIDVKLQMSP